MKIRVALNGFGEAGQQLLHHIYTSHFSERFEVVAINEIEPAMNCIHSLFNTYKAPPTPYQIACKTNELRINEQIIHYFSIPNEAELPWRRLNIDLVVESSSYFNQVFTSKQHIHFGAKRVLVANHANGSSRLWVNGINDSLFSGTDKIIEQASELTQAVAPVIAIIDKEFVITQCHIEHLCKSDLNNAWFDQNDLEIFSRKPLANLSLPKQLTELSEIKNIFPKKQKFFSGRAVQCEFKDHSLAILNFDLDKNVKAFEVVSAIEIACKTWLRSFIGLKPERWLMDKMSNDFPTSHISLERTTVVGKKLRIPVVFDSQVKCAQRIFEFAAQLNQQVEKNRAVM